MHVYCTLKLDTGWLCGVRKPDTNLFNPASLNTREKIGLDQVQDSHGYTETPDIAHVSLLTVGPSNYEALPTHNTHLPQHLSSLGTFMQSIQTRTTRLVSSTTYFYFSVVKKTTQVLTLTFVFIVGQLREYQMKVGLLTKANNNFDHPRKNTTLNRIIVLCRAWLAVYT